MADKDKVTAATTWITANIIYTSDSVRWGVVDYWYDAVGTIYSGQGDCEDMAMLLHSLLQAGGVPGDRLRTYFGYYNSIGHAWVAYRRELDNEWVILDATAGVIEDVDALPLAKENGVYDNAWAYLTSTAYVLIPAGQYLATLGISEAVVDFPTLECDARGAHAWTGQGTFPSLQCLAYGNYFGQATLSRLSASANGRVGKIATLAVAWPKIRISAHGLTGVLGDADFIWVELQGESEGYIIPEGSAIGSLPFLIADGYGTADDRFDDYILRHSRW
jgi:hypothetical protein